MPLDELRKKSLERISSDRKFNEIGKIDSLLRQFSNKYRYYPVSFNGYQEFLSCKEKIVMEINQLTSEKSGLFSVKNLPAEEDQARVFPYYAEIFERLKAEIFSDVYIGETYNIMNDYLKISNP